MRRRPTHRLAAFLAVLALLCTACAGSDTSPSSSAPTLHEDVRRGGTLVYATSQTLAGFNQHSPRSARLLLANVMYPVWPSAFDPGPDGLLVLNCELLESAELTSSSPQTIVYRIRPDAHWSDGVPITARDFIYLWRTAYTPGAKDVDGSDILATSASVRGAIASVTADDDKTVTVTFARSYPDWQGLFRFIVPAHVAERVGWNRGFDAYGPSVAVSGGPFRIAAYRPDQDLTLVRNERYWGTPANLDSIVVRFLPDSGQVLSAIKNGEVDLADSPSPTADAVAQARQVPGLAVQLREQSRYGRLYFNFRNPLLAEVDVRRAVALAVDRPGILVRFSGQVDPAKAKITNGRLYVPDEPGYRDMSGGRYDRPDRESARRLFEAAGFRLGADGVYARGDERASFRMPNPGDIGALLQAQLRDAGVEVRMEGPQDALQKGDFDLALTSRPTGPTEVAAQFSTGAGFNHGRYSNPAVDDLIRQADAELDPARRLALHHRIEEILWDDMPTLPLQQALGVVFHRDTFANIVPALGGLLFWNAARWGIRSG